MYITVPVRVAEAPANLRHFFLVEGLNVTANVSWDAPLSELPIVAYQIDWNQLNAFSGRSFTVSKVKCFTLLTYRQMYSVKNG